VKSPSTLCASRIVDGVRLAIGGGLVCVACGVWQAKAKHLRQVSHINASAHTHAHPSHLAHLHSPPSQHRTALAPEKQPSIAIYIAIAPPAPSAVARTSQITNTIPAAGRTIPGITPSPHERRCACWHVLKSVANTLLPPRDGGSSPSTSPCSHKRRSRHRPQQRSPGCEHRALMRHPHRPQSCSTRTHHITMPCG
jgi:hypothetical protein